MTIELRGIVKAFGSRLVVDNLDLVVADGGFTVLLGPSGCGKTTTLRMIAGLEAPQSGDILLNGRTVTNLSPKARGVAMVFQDYGLYPHMSVLENVAFPLKIARIPVGKRRSQAHEMLRRLRLDHLARQRPGRISGGEKQRVSLARALVRRPNILLMDEPLSNLDAMLRVRMRAEIKALHQELGTTTLYVTHDQIEALSLGTAIAVMRGGKVEQYATPHEVYREPATLFVARFVGSPAMNLLPVTFRREENLDILSGEGFSVVLPVQLAGLPAAMSRDGRAIMGVRPEHLAVGPPRTADSLDGTVRIVEPLGQDQYVHVAVGDTIVIVRTSPEQAVAVGERVGLRPTSRKICFFDPTTERRIC
jgi:multiple sugar transport system ATP-binding protein